MLTLFRNGGFPMFFILAFGFVALERALAELPTASREVLVLIGVEGIDQERAAAILGIGYAALRQRLARARAELARRMEGAALEKAGAQAKMKQRTEGDAT